MRKHEHIWEIWSSAYGKNKYFCICGARKEVDKRSGEEVVNEKERL